MRWPATISDRRRRLHVREVVVVFVLWRMRSPMLMADGRRATGLRPDGTLRRRRAFSPPSGRVAENVANSGPWRSMTADAHRRVRRRPGRESSGLELVRDIAPLVGGLSVIPTNRGVRRSGHALPELQELGRHARSGSRIPFAKPAASGFAGRRRADGGLSLPDVAAVRGLDVITIMTAPDAAATTGEPSDTAVDVIDWVHGDLAKRSDLRQRSNRHSLAQLWPPRPRAGRRMRSALSHARCRNHLWLDQRRAR